MENSVEFPQKIKNRTTIWSSNPTLRHISREKHGPKVYMHHKGGFLGGHTPFKFQKICNPQTQCYWDIKTGNVGNG